MQALRSWSPLQVSLLQVGMTQAWRSVPDRTDRRKHSPVRRVVMANPVALYEGPRGQCGAPSEGLQCGDMQRVKPHDAPLPHLLSGHHPARAQASPRPASYHWQTSFKLGSNLIPSPPSPLGLVYNASFQVGSRQPACSDSSMDETAKRVNIMEGPWASPNGHARSS